MISGGSCGLSSFKAEKVRAQTSMQAVQATPLTRRQRAGVMFTFPRRIGSPFCNAPDRHALMHGKSRQKRQKPSLGSINGVPSKKEPGLSYLFIAKKGQAFWQFPHRLHLSRNFSSGLIAPGGRTKSGKKFSMLSMTSEKKPRVKFAKPKRLFRKKSFLETFSV